MGVRRRGASALVGLIARGVVGAVVVALGSLTGHVGVTQRDQHRLAAHRRGADRGGHDVVVEGDGARVDAPHQRDQGGHDDHIALGVRGDRGDQHQQHHHDDDDEVAVHARLRQPDRPGGERRGTDDEVAHRTHLAGAQHGGREQGQAHRAEQQRTEGDVEPGGVLGTGPDAAHHQHRHHREQPQPQRQPRAPPAAQLTDEVTGGDERPDEEEQPEAVGLPAPQEEHRQPQRHRGEHTRHQRALPGGQLAQHPHPTDGHVGDPGGDQQQHRGQDDDPWVPVGAGEHDRTQRDDVGRHRDHEAPAGPSVQRHAALPVPGLLHRPTGDRGAQSPQGRGSGQRRATTSAAARSPARTAPSM